MNSSPSSNPPIGEGASRVPGCCTWFRSPPNIKVGREPFDPDVRRTLEARHPDVPFDWPAIISTPIPPVETENWRERRRVERAARLSEEDVPEPSEASAVPEPDAPPLPVLPDAPPPVAIDPKPVVSAQTAEEPVIANEPADEEALPATTVEPTVFMPNSSSPVAGRRRRRRRRRRGGQQRDQVAAAISAAEPPIHEVGAVDSEASDPDAQGEEPASGGPDEEV